MTSEKEQVLANLRACVISSQGGIRATELNNDYRCLVGELIPFKRLGYSNLETFLCEIPNVDVNNKNGEWWVQAKMDSASSHIQRLVQGQNRNKSRKPKRKANFVPKFCTSTPRYVSKPSQVPHFMQTKPSFQPSPKPKTIYIAPRKSPGKRNAASIDNADWVQRSMPTVVIDPKSIQKPALLPTPGDDKKVNGRTMQEQNTVNKDSKQSLDDRNQPIVNIRMRNTGAESFAKPSSVPRRPPLLPTPVRFPGPVMPNPLQRMPIEPQFPPQQAPLPAAPVSANPARPLPSLSTPQVPPSRPPVVKKSVGDRLLMYKNKAQDSVQESLEDMSLQPSNGISPSCPSSAQTRIPVKFVNPISFRGGRKGTLSEAASPSSPVSSHRLVPEYAHEGSNYIIKLHRYAVSQKWPQPEFFVLTRCVKKGPIKTFFYLCRVSVNCTPADRPEPNAGVSSPTYEFSSYPDEFTDSNVAMNSVAKKAYEALVKKTTIKLPMTEKPELIFERMIEMTSGKTQGVWLFQVEREYTEKYGETLPSNLPELLKNDCPEVEITKLAESYYLIRPKAAVPPDSPKKVQEPLGIGRVPLPNEVHWEVFISKVKSLNEVYIRLIGEQSNQYELMCEQMEKYYVNGRGVQPVNILLGGYYVYMSDTPCRCMVTGALDGEYQIYLIDIGDVEFVDGSALRELLTQFHELPAQAIPCFLDNLDNFDFALTDRNRELSDNVLNTVLGKSFAAIVHCRDPIRLYLIDTEGEVDVVINLSIKKLVLDSFSDPKLAFQHEGFWKTVNVSSIDSEGKVYLQTPSWTLDCLNDKFSMMSNGVFEVVHLSRGENLSSNKLYCCYSHPTRVRILRVLSDGMVLVDCVDTGGVMEIGLNDIFEVPLLDDLLPYIPPQAVRVLMKDVNDGTLTPLQAKKTLEAINATDQPCIGKVVSHVDQTPVVELFFRHEKNKLLVSLNQNIAMPGTDNDAVSSIVDDEDTYSIAGYSTISSAVSHAPTTATNGTMNSTSLTKADAPLAPTRPGNQSNRYSADTPLARLGAPCKSEAVFNKGPVTFKINDELEVYVTRIANPGNFTVIPGRYLDFLNKLIDDMTVHYSLTSPTSNYVPQPKECVAGYSGGCWFRVQINKQHDSDCFSGKFLDQGHMEMFAVKSLRPLHEKFKKLPYLAFKGKLHGIKPVNGADWEVEDCIRLKDMIQGQKLYAIVRDIISSGDSKVLSLELIDTSTDEDIYITRQLIVEKRALADDECG